MLDTNRLKKTAPHCAMLIALLWLCLPLVRGQNIVSVGQIRPDKACGPRCLLALVKITGVGRQDCGLKCIYEMIGKEPLSVTSLGDLKDAAKELGFKAEGYKLGLAQLRKMKGYAILAVGPAPGTARAPFHFVLAKRLMDSHAILVNTTTLDCVALPLDDLKKIWSGYALVLTSPDRKKPLPKPPDDSKAGLRVPDRIDQAWNFGIVDDGSMMEHTFIIHPVSDGPCKIELLGKSCTCVEATLGSDTAGNRTLTMKLRVKQPAWQSASANVRFDPPGVTRQYAVKAFGRATFRTNPSEGYVEITSDEKVEYPVQVIYHTDANDFATFNRITGDSLNVASGPVRSRRVVSTQDGAETVSYFFDVPLICQARVDSGGPQVTHGNIGFLFDTAKGEKLVSLKLTVKAGTERTRVFPEKVFLMASKAGAPAQRNVKVEFLQKPYPANMTVRVDEVLPVEVNCTRLADNAYMASVVVPSGRLSSCSPGKQSGAITFVPEGGQEPIQLPISVFVRK